MALYQKYRPKTLQELVGQDFVRQTLSAALKKNQASHAYLFFGSRGTGKTSTARILAKALNCHNAQPEGDPCNECEFCRAADNGSFVDLIEIDGASNRKIEHARALIERINFTPTLGKRKVYIIDEVHMLTREAFNALLKTIEEPPEHAFFLLATTELQKVPETIRSRCQVFTFHRFTPEQIAKRLHEIADKENITASHDALLLIAKKAVGGLRDAIGLFEQAASSGEVSVEYLQKELGLASESQLNQFYDFLETGDAVSAVDFVAEVSSEGLSLEDFLEQFLGVLRHKMLQFSLSDTPQRGDLDFVFRSIALFDEARRSLRDAPIPVFPLEIAIIKLIYGQGDSTVQVTTLSAGKPSQQTDSVPKKASPQISGQSSGQNPESKKSVPVAQLPKELLLPQSAVSDTTLLTPESIRLNMRRILEKLEDAVLKASLLQAQIEVEGPAGLIVTFPSEFIRSQVESKDRASRLIETIQDIFGPEVSVRFDVKSVILEPVGKQAAVSANRDDHKPVTDPAVISEIFEAGKL